MPDNALVVSIIVFPLVAAMPIKVCFGEAALPRTRVLSKSGLGHSRRSWVSEFAQFLHHAHFYVKGGKRSLAARANRSSRSVKIRVSDARRMKSNGLYDQIAFTFDKDETSS
ncbi:hypothetical protein C1J03_07250 [Sulfitobacter sp. SK012]|nr:hypothetical protein C1J03_07250 [Sulfitobacter sp. SK012]